MAVFPWSRKQGQAAAAAPKGAEADVIYDAGGRAALVFGTTWRSLVSASSERDCLKLARGAKATHFLMLGRQVGFTRMPADVLKDADPPVLLPASLVAGRHYGGNAVFALRLPENDEAWFAVVRNGAPTSVDEAIKHLLLPQMQERTQALIDGLAEDSVEFAVYSDIEGVQGAKPCSIEELFRLTDNREGALRPLPKQGMSIPTPMLVTLGVIVGGLLLTQGYKAGAKLWGSYFKPPAIVGPAEDLPAIWKATFDRWMAAQVGANATGLRMARDALAAIPAQVGGWRLVSANCGAQPIVAGARKRTWSCQVSYTRLPGAVLNRDLMPALPPNWTTTVKPMNAVSAVWSFEEDALPALDPEALQSVRHHLVDTGSDLQRIMPVLSSEPALAFGPVVIEAPKTSDGKPIGAQHAPELMEKLQTSALRLKGPMRTIDYVLGKSNLPADWTQLSMTLAGAPGTQTRLHMEATGVIYARN